MLWGDCYVYLLFSIIFHVCKVVTRGELHSQRRLAECFVHSTCLFSINVCDKEQGPCSGCLAECACWLLGSSRSRKLIVGEFLKYVWKLRDERLKIKSNF